MLPTRGQPAFVMEAFALLVLDKKSCRIIIVPLGLSLKNLAAFSTFSIVFHDKQPRCVRQKIRPI